MPFKRNPGIQKTLDEIKDFYETMHFTGAEFRNSAKENQDTMYYHARKKMQRYKTGERAFDLLSGDADGFVFKSMKSVLGSKGINNVNEEVLQRFFEHGNYFANGRVSEDLITGYSSANEIPLSEARRIAAEVEDLYQYRKDHPVEKKT